MDPATGTNSRIKNHIIGSMIRVKYHKLLILFVFHVLVNMQIKINPLINKIVSSIIPAKCDNELCAAMPATAAEV